MATINTVKNDSSIFDQINSANNRGTTTKAEDQQTKFLTLLTTQLKNQDPLNPMDNAQMTSQLAQISTVDGIERLNATLASMMSSTSETQASFSLRRSSTRERRTGSSSQNRQERHGSGNASRWSRVSRTTFRAITQPPSRETPAPS